MEINDGDVLARKFENIKRWKLNHKTAVHKPLLTLYVLSQYKNGHGRLFNFEYELYSQLRSLLELYGSGKRSQNPEYPFWRLQKDGFWEVVTQEEIILTSSGDAPKKQLFETKAEGGFRTYFYEKLLYDSNIMDLLSLLLVQTYFPVSLHQSLTQYFQINLSRLSSDKISENCLGLNSSCDLLEELLSEFNM